jgi:uncharacterized tellurite resistance protein B-like protein
MHFIKKFFIKSLIEERNVEVITDLFAIAVYADEKINVLEINQVKRNIENYVNTYYFMLNSLKKKMLIDYLYKETLKKIRLEKNNCEYIDYLFKQLVYHSKFIEDIKTRKMLLKMFKDILLSDKVFSEEEKRYYNKLEDFFIKKSDKDI